MSSLRWIHRSENIYFLVYSSVCCCPFLFIFLALVLFGLMKWFLIITEKYDMKGKKIWDDFISRQYRIVEADNQKFVQA